MNPLISIILPTYNGSEYLADSIQSCLSQTYQNFELVIVDDASTDSTAEVIAFYASQDSRIKSICHKQNKKLPASLNSGFAVAKGQFLTWTSDDNQYDSAALEHMLLCLSADEEIALVYCDYNVIGESGCVDKLVRVSEANELHKNNVVGACFLYRREIYDDLGGYDESLFLVEDYEYWLRASVKYTFYPLHLTLYYYRDHDRSLTQIYQTEITRLRDNLISDYLPVLPWLNSDKKSKAFIDIAHSAYRRGNRRETARFFIRSFASACRPINLRDFKLLGYVVLGDLFRAPYQYTVRCFISKPNCSE